MSIVSRGVSYYELLGLEVPHGMENVATDSILRNPASSLLRVDSTSRAVHLQHEDQSRSRYLQRGRLPLLHEMLEHIVPIAETNAALEE